MLTALGIIAPIFLAIGLGYLCTYFRLVSSATLRGMGRYILLIALPAIIFEALTAKPLDAHFDVIYCVGFALGSALSFAIGIALSKIRKQDNTTAILNGFGQSFGNSAFVGFPILLACLGENGNIYFSLNTLIENLLIIPCFLLMADLATSKKAHPLVLLKQIFFNLFKNPLFIAVLLGLVVAFLRIPIPAPVHRTIQLFGHSGPALALFVVGGSLVGLRLRGCMGDIAQVTIGKLLIHPLLVLATLYFFGASIEAIFAGVLMSSIMTASSFSLFGAVYGQQRRCSAIILSTTIVSIFTLTAVICIQQSFFAHS